MDSNERMKNLIARFILKYNYWGYLFSRIRRKENSALPSIMGVAPEKDGTISLYYNGPLVEKTEDSEILRILEHEGMHLLNKHVSRLLRIISNEASKDVAMWKSRIWNIAADCTVNVQAGITEPITIAGVKVNPKLPQEFKLEPGAVTEYYYIELLKKAKEQQKKGKGKKGEGGPGENGLGYARGTMDNHDQWVVEGVPDVSSLSRKVDSYTQGVIKDSLKTFSKDRGNLPAHISELIQDALAPPKVPYYQLIRRLVRGTRLSKFKRSFTKINRKRTFVFTLGDDKNIPVISPFPGKTRDYTFDIVVLIDTSGSMSPKDILEGLSGIKNIIENDRHCHTTVLEVDTTIEKEYRVRKVRDIQFSVKGRGGTTLGPGLLRARELGCDVCLAFTDGYVENINSISRKELPRKIIWVVTEGGTSNNINRTGFIIKI